MKTKTGHESKLGDFSQSIIDMEMQDHGSLYIKSSRKMDTLTVPPITSEKSEENLSQNNLSLRAENIILTIEQKM
jgi:hypothetical protein